MGIKRSYYETTSVIEKNKDNPFFIYLAYNAPHTPLQATEKYLSRFENIKEKKRKTYAAMVSAVDDGVGLILAKLEELKLTENTIVVFLSDNGGPERTNGSDNGILRGQKGDLFEGGIRVPFAMQWPAKLPSGKVYENPIISLDIFATIIAQSRQPVKLKNPIDGTNLIPYLTGEDNSLPHEQLFWRKYDAKDYAIRKGDEKLLIKGGLDIMLFNLNKDISEENNNAKLNESLVNQLNNDIDNREKEMIDPKFMGLMQDADYNKQHPQRFKREK